MLKGIGVSGGYGIGQVIIVRDAEVGYTLRSDCDPREEGKRFDRALEAFLARNTMLAEQVRASVGAQEGEIIAGHIMIMQDPSLRAEVEERLNAGLCAEAAVAQVCDVFIEMFSSTDDDYTRQRAVDVRDIKEEMLRLLAGDEIPDLSCLAPGTVLVATELTPSMTAGINKENVVGLVTEVGSVTAHAAILARAMEIPAVLGVPDATKALKSGETIVVDGTDGAVLPNPTASETEMYKKKRAAYLEEKATLSRFIGRPTVTADGRRVELFGNIARPEEVERVLAQDGEGIGLFRTEFLFMERTSAPGEEEQFEAYKQVLSAMKGRKVIIRTLDIGGDKAIPYMDIRKEENPFLGFRGIRFCLGHKDIFTTQLRALLRASHYGNLSVMIPLVIDVQELREVKAMIRALMTQLDAECIPYDRELKVGVMIETPAAALTADLLAEEADFFSIGTNDLIGYTLAVDRGNARVAHLYTPLAPAVLRSIRNVITEAKKAGIPVGMCGEAAADPRMIPQLLSFGLDEFSVAPNAILATRREIAKV